MHLLGWQNHGFVLFFVATTPDSTAYILAPICTRDLPADAEPARVLRFAWAIILAVTPIGLMAVNALESVQIASIIGALPMIPISILLTVLFVKYVSGGFSTFIQGAGKQESVSGCRNNPTLIDHPDIRGLAIA
ncbi:MAG: hypothetical protein DSY90_11790 [Deltaproteobacteria bacterium]|nr:MAG: hypothetical protein DSY90_11790 [Deltaproteobacteria bacterium]